MLDQQANKQLTGKSNSLKMYDLLMKIETLQLMHVVIKKNLETFFYSDWKKSVKKKIIV